MAEDVVAGPVGFAEFESDKTYHILRCISPYAYWRIGVTYCGRVLDEERVAVELYDGEYGGDRLVCKNCQTERYKREQLEKVLNASRSSKTSA